MASTWRGLIDGRSGICRHSGACLPTCSCRTSAGVVEDFGPGTASEDPAIAKLGSRFIHLSMAAARAAWADSGLDRTSTTGSIAHRAAVVIGSAFGGLDLLETEQDRMRHRKSLAVSPYLVPAMIINQPAGQIAQHLRLYGPSAAPANACASGGHAIVLGAMFLRPGDAEIALCGAGESAFTPAVVNGFATMKALLGRKPGDRSESDPAQASRPFSVDRAGFVLAEGAGAVVLATETADARLRLERPGRARGLVHQFRRLPHGDALSRADHPLPGRRDRSAPGSRPETIDYYNAHGTSTVLNDRVETQVLKDVFGDAATTAADQLDQRGARATAWARPRPSRRRSRSGHCASRSSRRRSTTCPTRSSIWITYPTKPGQPSSTTC